MVTFWKSLTYITKFSVIAFIATITLGFLSTGTGVLGLGLYYLVSFLFTSFLALNDWHGDWIWP